MAEEPQPAAPAETVVVPSEIPAEKSAEKDPPPSVPEAEAELSKRASETETVTESGDKKPGVEKQTIISESVSFKEESNRVSDLPEPHKKALEELKQLIQEALNKHEFTAVPPPKEEEPPKAEPEPEPEEPKKAEADETVKPVAVEEPLMADRSAPAVDDDGAKTVEAIEETVVSVAAVPPPVLDESPATPPVAPEEVFIWGIPLIGDEKSDVVLLKFLRARDFKAKDAFFMIKNTVLWRKDFSIDTLLEEDLGNDLEKVVFMHGVDKEGHQVCYNVYGEFQNKELYDKSFSDAEKRQKFLRWRIQFLEKSIRQQLDFTPDGICSFFQVTDLRNSPGPGKKELRQATNQALNVLQDNYPEFVAKQVFINVPWWYVAFNRMISPFLTHRTKSKFVFAGPSKSSETLFRYIAPEQVPVQYGGMSKEDSDFTIADPVTEITIKPASKHCIEFPATEPSLVVWELRVLGWDVSYGAEFVPSAEDGYTVIVQKTRKITPADEPVIKNSFKIGEPGKVVLTIDNTSSKKKKLLYRSKSKTSSGSI